MPSESEGGQELAARRQAATGCALGCASIIALVVLLNLAIRWDRGEEDTVNPFTLWAALALVLAAVGFRIVLVRSTAGSSVPGAVPAGCRRCGEAFGERARLAGQRVGGLAFGPDLQEQLEALAMLPYRCRSCGSLLHKKCAHAQPCPQCGGSVFDQV